MSSISFKRQDLYALVEHHIALLERFNIVSEAPFALIYFHLDKSKDDDSGIVFQRILRKTDALFQEKNHYIVMLPGTDWNGGIDLLSGIQGFLDQEPKDTIVTFPEDGQNADELIEKLQEIIRDEYNIILKILEKE